MIKKIKCALREQSKGVVGEVDIQYEGDSESIPDKETILKEIEVFYEDLHRYTKFKTIEKM